MTAFLISAAVWLALITVGHLIERRRPAASISKSGFNAGYGVFVCALQAVLGPLAEAETAWLSSRVGAPFVHLPVNGLWLAASALVLIAAKDFLDYWFHRAQHAFPALWAMHSFHHSDRAMNVTTSQRHFWGDRLLTGFLVYVPLGLIFAIPQKLALAFAAGAMFFSLFPHMNLRLEFGRCSWLILGPQLHRKHHSALPEHYNANYAGVFPVWDVVFGSYRAPQPGEFPPTGIDEEPNPDHICAAIAWPLRNSRLARRPEDYSAAGSKSVAAASR